MDPGNCWHVYESCCTEDLFPQVFHTYFFRISWSGPLRDRGAKVRESDSIFTHDFAQRDRPLSAVKSVPQLAPNIPIRCAGLSLIAWIDLSLVCNHSWTADTSRWLNLLSKSRHKSISTYIGNKTVWYNYWILKKNLDFSDALKEFNFRCANVQRMAQHDYPSVYYCEKRSVHRLMYLL